VRKRLSKMLIKLTAGVTFIYILQVAAFTRTDFKSAKNTVKLSVFFVLLGFSQAKAASRILMKLTPCNL
jgi:hypothetical protein